MGGRYPEGIRLFQVESKRPSDYQVMRLSPKWTQEVGGSAATVALGPGAQVCSRGNGLGNPILQRVPV